MSRLVPKHLQQPAQAMLLLAFVTTLTAGVSFPFLQPVIPIFYSLSQPEKQLVDKWWIFLFPVFSWLITASHLLLIGIFKEIETNIQKLFSWTSVALLLVNGIILLRLIMIVT
ncbi:MAG: hypothetical protein COU63_02740 [Candidatus Pacebacteria bacterium CG10_big_fil_rev_8_21_14_0_10_36_11]|nr:hypothetical protein [Candidatus Pacearchaeota archaeon]OIP74345.1 MAG: hypothetical protein AUK08_00995 [Candidatus Pacebacteria bacterium CG2_30_36_39]PIR64909.1 MAG: hypothetical protein COU63_02740 [Candidatus Pacebacteria bacterium CG10_big_fil_rev_8_21_14_0_10_36_11]PJC42977.1 MAG: hypothetical protein CO040_01615 [Candidatus Pacebacteria bacterium CG_4_9_14_0_2_um_filter_36_8]